MSEQHPESRPPLPPAAPATAGSVAPQTLPYVQLYDRYDDVVDSRASHLVRFISPFMWGFIGLICVGIVTGAFTLMMPYIYGLPLALVSDAIVILAIARMVRVIRRNRAGAVVAVLEQAARLNLPLTSFVAAAAAGEPRVLGRRLNAIGAYLSQGLAVSDALRAAVPELSERSVSLLASAERRGRLAPALATLRDELRPWHRRLPPSSFTPSATPHNSAGFYFLYPAFLLLVIQFMLTGIMIFVMPKFREIFNDFRVDLPPITEYLLNSTDFMAHTWLLGLLQLLVLGLIIFVIGRVVEETLFLRRRIPLLGSWTSRIRWIFPLTHTLDRDEGLADICGLLTDALRSGATIPSAISEALSLPVNIVLHERLAKWARLHAQGVPLAKAADQAKLPHLMSGLLATTGPSAAPGSSAANASGLADALDFLQRYYSTRLSRLATFLRSAFEPACVLVLGVIVGTVVVSLLYPLVVLINSVAIMSPNAGGY